MLCEWENTGWDCYKIRKQKKDCVSFSKKYETRKMDDLFQYYEGAKWAIDYALSVVNESKE